jgi:hypothetical protein
MGSGDPVFYRQFFIATHAGEVVAIGGVKAADWATKHAPAVSLGGGPGTAWAGHRPRPDQGAPRLDRIDFRSPAAFWSSAARTRRFRDLGFREVRNSASAASIC